MPTSCHMLRCCLFCGLLAFLGLPAGEVTAWIEAEAPTTSNFPVAVDAQNAGLLSGGQRLIKVINKANVAKELPADGLLLSYEFTCATAGRNELWMRVGYEDIRAPIEWRIDQGDWSELTNETLSTNVMEASNWNALGWVRCGPVDLKQGKRTLALRIRSPAKNEARVMLSLDCLALIQGGGFIPEGLLKPGETYAAEVDKQAAAQVFRFTDLAASAGPARLELPLDGLWQAARFDDPDMDVETYAAIQEIPTAATYPLRWMGLDVPGNAFAKRPELMFGHRFFYQTRVEIPADLAGRGFFLHFSGTTWIASVFVNGQLCGERKSVLVPWDLDITRAVKPGAVNTLVIGIKSPGYAVDGKTPTSTFSRNQYRHFPRRDKFPAMLRYVDSVVPTSKGEGNGLEVGLVNPVKLVVAGSPYSADVFVKASVAKKSLEAEIEVLNPGTAVAQLEIRCEAVHEKTGKVEKVFAPTLLTVPAGELKLHTVGGSWPEAKLWWPAESAADKPDCYLLRTTILANGKPVDRREDLFGFREVTIDGRHILLNGQRWHFWNWVNVPDKSRTGEGWLNRYFAQNDRFQRFGADTDRWLGTREKALDFHDRNGIPGRLSTCIDGMEITTNPSKPEIWKNYENHVRQTVRAYRNHPSIINWSLGNEYLLVTCRLQFGNIYEQCEENFMKLCAAAKEVDPTRAAYEDGAGDLGGSSEINNQHYAWKTLPDVPASLYDYPTGPAVTPRPNGAFDFDKRRQLYLWDGKRPLILGEEFYYAGSGTMAWFGGPEVYRSKKHQDRAATHYIRMGIEGARWQDVAGICPWMGALPGAEKSFLPRAVFVREHDSCFFPGATLSRTIGVFNDSRSRDPLTVKWRLVLAEKTAAQGEKTYTVEPGCHADDTLVIKLPAADMRLDGELQLELLAQGRSVFADARPISVVPSVKAAKGFDGASLALYDPAGKIAAWLQARGQPFTRLATLAAPATSVKCLLIGPEALTDELRTSAAPALRDFVFKGNTLLVLEQTTPLQQADLPVSGISLADGSRTKDLAAMAEFQKVRGNSGSLSFPVALAHPVLSGMKRDDLFTWAGGGMNYRLSYDTPIAGTICLIQAGEDLCLTPMLEIPMGSGSYLLSQTLIGEKLGVSPVADLLLGNMLTWAWARAGSHPEKTVVCTGGDQALAAVLASIKVEQVQMDSPAAVLASGGKLAVIRATAAALKELRTKEAELRAFCDKGGWIMLSGLDQDGLADFNALVGFQHRLRPCRIEAARLRNHEDPLLLGLSDREFTQYGDTVIAPWRNLKAVSNHVFTLVVDGEDVASFAASEQPRLTDGLLFADFWKYTHTMSSTGDGVAEFKLDRPETLTQLNIWTGEAYYYPKEIEVVLDGTSSRKITLEPDPSMQTFELGNISATTLALKVLSHYPNPACEKDLVQIDELELLRQVPDDFSKRVVFLSKPGGLVKYQIGQGGIILNQIDYTSKDSENNLKGKRTIYANLLRNMGASFQLSKEATGK